MTDENAASVAVRDHALWLGHISGDPQLVAQLSELAGGATIELVIGGQPGTWKKLDNGVDGRPTQALKPVSEAAKAHWHELQERRGSSVSMSKLGAATSSAITEPRSVEAGDTSPSFQQSAFIAKIDPIPIPQSGRVLIFAPVYGDTPPQADATVYLWFSETKGGNGLARRGVIRAVEDGAKPSILVQLDTSRVTKGLGKGDLSPHRDSLQATPLAGLARKLFKHSLNKVTELAPNEEAYLAARMTEVATPATAKSDLAIAEFAALENLPGDGRRMLADTARYRLTTTTENASVEQQIKPGTLRGAAAEFIRAAGGVVVGRDLHLHMLKVSELGKWDYGYVHSARAKARDWIRQA